MEKMLIATFLTLAIISSCFGQIPKVVGGTINRFENFASKYVQPRNIDVWLPANYDSTRKYAVLYMHDGQMLFDSTITWNHQEWKVDETVTKLLQERKIRDVIIVGIWNNGIYRHAEYFPQKPLADLPASISDTLTSLELMLQPQADNYLLFLTRELKPFIDRQFATLPDRDNTFIAGSSMGGLISIYALCEYPNIFGGAACLSTHWPGSLQRENELIPKAIDKYLIKKLPPARHHKIYFDYGTAALDSLYKPYQQLVDKTMKAKGYSGKNWITKEFTGDDHSERAWSRRFYIPLIFLLNNRKEDPNLP